MRSVFEDIAYQGPMLLAVGAAALAGLVSFLSPCVLPLVPGYLSYVTGLAGADLDAALGVRPAPSPAAATVGSAGGAVGSAGGAVATAGSAGGAAATATAGRRRVLAGTALFVAGFTAMFVALAVLVSQLRMLFLAHQRAVDIGMGALVVLFGLAFLGLVPGMQREWRIHRLPAAGLSGAPVLGAVFAVSWIPCTGPTLGAVLAMAATGSNTTRAAVLAVAYCLGLGVPFVLFGLAYRRLLGLFRAVRRNSRWVTRIGGALLIAMGIVMIAGGWISVLIWLQTTFSLGIDLGSVL